MGSSPISAAPVTASRLITALLLGGMLSACSLRPNVREVAMPLPDVPGRHVEQHQFFLPAGDSIVGRLAAVEVRTGDSLPDLARHFGLGLEEISTANPGVDVWAPDSGTRVLLPLEFTLPDAPPKGIVVNLASMRLFQFSKVAEGVEVVTYPVGIGKEGRSTPLGSMAIERKVANPTWYVPASIRRDHELKGDPLPAAVSPGPDNPLGDFALYLSRPSYLIHGTNKPYSIGLRASNGCIRLYPENIAKLFQDTPVKTPVRIVNQPYLLGWRNGELYLTAYEPHEELNSKELRKKLVARLKKIEKETGKAVNWPKVTAILDDHPGVPVPVFSGTESLEHRARLAIQVSRPAVLYGQPTVPNGSTDHWYIKVLETDDPLRATRLTAVLNHQGPQIPARSVLKEGRYQVIAGPFEDSKTTKTVAKRMKIDLEIEGSILPPERQLTMQSAR